MRFDTAKRTRKPLGHQYGVLMAFLFFFCNIEFYTMLMLSVIFLPFGVTERLAFLSNSSISLMFNSGAKMMVMDSLEKQNKELQEKVNALVDLMTRQFEKENGRGR